MTKKKKKVGPTSKYSSVSFKVEETLVVAQGKSVPLNLAEEKARFLRTGQTPRFEVQDQSKIAELAGKTKNKIRFDLLGEAEYILESVRDQYGDGELFLEHAFGSRITKEQATPMVLEYISENSLSESLKIHWCDSIACSAKMVWKGPVMNANKPELRKYSLWINGSDENNYMRESGIKCLMDHEIGTHFFRLINDGFQPWFSERTRFDLRNVGSFESQCTEEGLASIHTALRGRVRMLWSPALAYYTACKAAEMSFKELFDHLGRYTSNIDSRWKQVMRVKRGLADPGDLGGFGNDQCYFEGAVKILRDMENIDFQLLMSGKICMDEVDRIKRCVRKDVLRFPSFMKNMLAYRRTLKKMLVLNGLDKEHYPRCAPAIFTRRLMERSNAGGDTSPIKSCKKVRSKPSPNVSHTCKLKGSASSGVGKKSSFDSRKEKGGKKKVSKSSSEVERFPVSSTFVNTFKLKQKEKERKEREDRANKLEESVRLSIASLDSDIGTHIENLRNIAREHTWSNCDSGYRDSLISEVSFEMYDSYYGDDGQTEEDIVNRFDRGDSDMTKFTSSLDDGICLESISNDNPVLNLYEDSQIYESDDETKDSTKKVNTAREPSNNCQRQGLPKISFKTRPKSSSILDAADLRSGSAGARNRLAGRRNVSLFPTSPLSQTNSLNRSKAEGNSTGYKNDAFSEQSIPKALNSGSGQNDENNSRQVEYDRKVIDESSCKQEDVLRQEIETKQSMSPNEKIICEQPCIDTSYTTMTSPDPDANKVSQSRILNRESLNPCTFQQVPVSNKYREGCKNTSFLTHQSTASDTTVVQYRIPKSQNEKSSGVKIKVPLPKVFHKSNQAKVTTMAASKDPQVISRNTGGDRQLARIKLGSLAKDYKIKRCVNVQRRHFDGPSISSIQRPAITEIL